MEKMSASGQFHVLCYDENGDLKWEEKNHNLVMNIGIQYMAGTALTSTTQITTWYIGLVTGPGSGTTFSGTDTIATKTWTEFTGYSQAARVTATFAAATNANPSVVTNSASVAAFTINASGTVAGAFLISNNTKGNSALGTLFSASDFTGGDRTVVSGDTLNVTYTFSLTAT